VADDPPRQPAPPAAAGEPESEPQAEPGKRPEPEKQPEPEPGTSGPVPDWLIERVEQSIARSQERERERNQGD
jgi:hypothetical protein